MLETEELLRANGFTGSPVIVGSALRALEAMGAGKAAAASDPRTQCIRDLVAALDSHVPDPVRDFASPFLMAIEQVCTIEGRGTVVTGRVGRGVLPVGATVEVIGLDDGDRPRPVVVTGIQSFHKERVEARAG